MWTVRKKFKGLIVNGLSKPLGEQTEAEILGLYPQIRKKYFYDKPDKRTGELGSANANGEGDQPAS